MGMKTDKFNLPSSLIIAALFILSLPTFVSAQTDIFVKGSGKLFPVALPRLCLQGGDPEAAKSIPDVMGRDLDVSGYFEVLNPNAYIETPGKCGGPESVVYSDWSVIGAEGLVRGVIESDASGIRVKLYLYDVQRQKIVLGKEYNGDFDQAPRMAHRFANEIMKYFTGEYGIFGSQIAFSSRVGRFKELFVMDMDGSNLRQLTNEKALAVSSAWDPFGKKLVYTSYRSRVPDLFELDVASRATRQVTRSQDLEVSPHYSKDGRSILVSISDGTDSDIVLMDLNGGILRRLTRSNGAIDVSPSWSADGSQVVFCSDRAGGPQIYVMGADGGGAHRISFVSSNYCTSPTWSPKGDKIAFVCRADAGFNLFVANADGSNPMQLTSGGDNEDPDWSPDGRYLTFSTTYGHRGIPNIAIVRSDGSGIREVTKSRSGDYEPTWGPAIN